MARKGEGEVMRRVEEDQALVVTGGAGVQKEGRSGRESSASMSRELRPPLSCNETVLQVMKRC